MFEIGSLSLFAPDDQKIADLPGELVEIVNVTPYGWERHCREAGSREQKYLSFELMSADIDFSKDHTDPEYPSWKKNSRTWAPWGLVHAMMGLARRDPTDQFRNRLPFVFEIRSVVKSQIKDDPAAMRIFSLLRALASLPQDNETLEACIIREHFETSGIDQPTDTSNWTNQQLYSVFREDVRNAEEQDRIVGDIIERLLPQWRSKFIDAIKEREVRVDVDGLEDQLRLMMKSTTPKEAKFYIPIADEFGAARYGLDLYSVMADIFAPNIEKGRAGLAFEFSKPHQNISIPGSSDPSSVSDWYDYMLKYARGGEWYLKLSAILRDVCKKVGEHYSDRKQGSLGTLLESYKGDQLRTGLYWCALIVYRHISFGLRFTSYQVVEQDCEITIDDPTFARPIGRKSNVFPQIGGPVKLAAALNDALDGRSHELGSHWEKWIKPGVKQWLDEIAGTDIAKNAGSRAPGLS